jgi:DNA-binding NarL/FixJ family response regulator
MLFFKKRMNNLKESVSIDELQRLTRILFIDDTDQSDLIRYLKNEGWDTEYIPDIEQITAKNIQNANILFIDVMGVGAKLRLRDGLDVVKLIKETYPSKKVVMYSTNEKQDYSHPGFEMADKRIVKRGSYDIFITTIMEMSKKMFTWEEAIKASYDKIKIYLQSEITLDQYTKTIMASIKKGKVDKEKITKTLKIGFDIFQMAYPFLEYVLKKGQA